MDLLAPFAPDPAIMAIRLGQDAVLPSRMIVVALSSYVRIRTVVHSKCRTRSAGLLPVFLSALADPASSPAGGHAPAAKVQGPIPNKESASRLSD